MRKFKQYKYYKILYSRSLIIIFLLFLCISIGYSAFSTNINIIAKGNIKKRILINDHILSLYNKNDDSLIDDNTNDHNIRYSGGDVDNYVCLKNETNCSEDNLYRIIGLFNNIKKDNTSDEESRVKLIRANVSGLAAYDSENVADFARPSSLNLLLNSSDLINYSFIDSTVWYLGYSAIGDYSSESYSSERSGVALNGYASSYTSKIGLMYQSDYGFASKNCYLTRRFWHPDSFEVATAFYDYSLTECKESNWLYLNTREWTLTPSYRSDLAYNTINYIVESGQVIDSTGGYPNNPDIYYRPTFYLKKDTYILDNGNDGSKEKPFILSH